MANNLEEETKSRMKNEEEQKLAASKQIHLKVNLESFPCGTEFELVYTPFLMFR